MLRQETNRKVIPSSRLAYFPLLRVQFVITSIVLAFMPLAIWEKSPLRPYLAGMYDIAWYSAAFAGAAAFLLWLALTISSNIVLRTATDRFGLPDLPCWARLPVFQWPIVRYAGLADIYFLSAALGTFYFLAVALMLSGLLVLSSGRWLTFAVAMASFILGPVISLAVGVLLKGRFAWRAAVIRFLFQGTPEGYIDPVSGQPESGQILSLTAFLGCMVIYLAGWFFKPGDALFGGGLATLVCVLVLLANLCWFFAAATYFFDRWRLPLFFAFVLWMMAGAFTTDHTFPLKPCGTSCKPTATAASILRAAPGKRIVVATSGGGILASAWTATVLGNLTASDPNFAPSLRLLSGVSGGSAGLMFYVNQLRNKGDMSQLFEAASASSLDAVAWGLAYPDFLRTFLVYRGDEDRSAGLRRAWARHATPLHGATLGGWRPDSLTPALIFNSTVEETGERFLFANYAVGPPMKDNKLPARRVFQDVFPNHDIAVTAAVSNSAAFPYVSPASRAEDGKKIHLVDGGYFDNFGVASAIDFLMDAYRADENLRKESILLVLIEASPESSFQGAGKNRTWPYQIIAPPRGLINMWQIAARARNFVDLDLLRAWLPEGRLQVARFVYTNPDSPTSWHLSPGQKEAIKAEWGKGSNPGEFDKVKVYLRTENE
jgi:hypothetical protein